MSTAVSIFDVNGTTEEVKLIQDALTAVRADVMIFVESNLPRHTVNFVDDIQPTSQGIHPEALYPGGNIVKIRRMRDANGNLKTYRLQGNFLHEVFGHGQDKYVIGSTKEQQIMKLFVPVATNWRVSPLGSDDYWKEPNESFCDWIVRVITNGKIISHWEPKRLLIPAENLPKLLPIIMTTPEPPTPTVPAIDPNGEDDQEMPLTNVRELERGAIAVGVPIIHPVTKKVMFKSSGSDSARLVGVTADGLYRGVLVMTKQIPGIGWKTALVASAQVTNVRVEDPSIALKEENEQLQANLNEVNSQLDTAEIALDHANEVAAADLVDAQSIVTRHS